MKIEIFALCDAAADYGGKLNLLGAFDGIHAAAMPMVQAHCAIALRLRIAKVEEGRHQLRFQIIDADGGPVVPPLDAAIDVSVPPHGDSVAVNVVINLRQLRFEQFGRYQLDLAIDGRQEATLPLAVLPLPPAS